jgi:predicted dehydrogenase
MNQKQLRWGILSTANIARKNWQAIQNSGNGTVTAVASRDAAKSLQFIQECQAAAPQASAPRALASYEALLQSPDVDAVYIPLPTGLRKEWVLKAARAGKHVVCEKPCGATLAEVQDMVRACRESKVQFMDGVMFMHSARLDRVREALDDGVSVGRLRRIATGFSFCAPEAFLSGNIRMHSGLEPHGCLGDLGWYCIRFALWALQWRLPHSVSGRFLARQSRGDSPSQVPTEFSGELLFDGGVSCTFYSSFLTEHQQWVHMSGTRGSISIPDFVLPYYGSEVAFEVNNPSFEVTGCQFNMAPHIRRQPVHEYSNNHPNAQETRLFRNFAAQVLSGTLNEEWPDIALKTQQVMERCLESARSDARLLSIA